MVIADSAMIVLALWLAFSLRLGEVFIPHLPQGWIFLSAVLLALSVFAKMGLYRAVIYFIEMRVFWTVFQAVSLMVLAWGVLLLLMAPHGVPRSSIIIFWLIALLLISAVRVYMRWQLIGVRQQRGKGVSNVLIYGAGEAGTQLAVALRMSSDLYPVAFVDDDPALVTHEVAGLVVYGSDEMEGLFARENIDQVLVAIPSISPTHKSRILNLLQPFPVRVRMLPGLDVLTDGRVRVDAIRDINVEDLLGRDAAVARQDLLAASIVDKVVMVTGAGGSIGSELCRQIVRQQPRSLVLFEMSEFALYAIERELRQMDAAADIEIVPLMGSVHHFNRVKQVCLSFAVQTIYHAAAYKHVPLVEWNPIEAVHNNVVTTMHVAQAAMAAKVERFVLISTDKAVRPTNVMGASKRCAELVLQALDTQPSSTLFCMVRFGNVLGSSGSVVPLFRQQIEAGGPVTVTHPDITRYFMTIPEAAQLVIQAGAMGKGGDLFVLDMGDPVKIVDLAKKMIQLSGLMVDTDDLGGGGIAIQFSGLRPGEKLYEELLVGDHVEGTDHPLIMRANEAMIAWERLQVDIDAMERAAQDFDPEAIRDLLQAVVEGYQPATMIHDLMWRKSNGMGEKQINIENTGVANV
ncbi:MAG: nucleoside-diphosphate sugar epimerase/dehydratase [Mariprofundales bacterium]